MEENTRTIKKLKERINDLEQENIFLRSKNTIEENLGGDFFFINILNHIGNPIFVKDKNSRLLIVNDAFCELFELKREQIIGKTLAEDVTKEERESFLKIDKQVISSGVKNINEEFITIRGGETKTIATTKTRYVDKQNNLFLIGIINDITQKHKTEQNLITSNNTKDKLFSIISHDLISPFNSILGFSEILLNNINDFDDEEIENFISNINKSAKTNLNLLKNLLGWAKIQTNKIKVLPQKFVLKNIIEKTIDVSVAASDLKNISLVYDKEEEIELHTDPDILEIVLRNLISNAIKFTKKNGQVKLTTSIYNQNLKINIIDNGVGMDFNTTQNLFKKNNSITTLGTESEEGTGLGLILCYEFTKKLKGTIKAESELDSGSVFTIDIPISYKPL